MGILRNPPNPNSKFKQGYFAPKHPEKYAGDPDEIIYRSRLEMRYMKYFDETPSIVKWGSEEVQIDYISPLDGKPHRYFPDFVIKVRDKNGKFATYIIEIKPKKETMRPVRGKKSMRKFTEEVAVYAQNEAKWKSASSFCERRGLKFIVMTEEEIKFSA